MRRDTAKLGSRVRYKLPPAHWRTPLSAPHHTSNIFLAVLTLLPLHSLQHLSVLSVSFTYHLHLVRSISSGRVYHRRRRDNLYIAATTPFPSLSSGLFLLITDTTHTESSSLYRSGIKKTKNRTRYRVLFLASCGCSLLKLEGEIRMVLFLGS
jgi:hypothetical protein